MSSQKKTLPKFTTKTSCKTWKNKVQMWQIVTLVEKNQQAITIFLESLEGNLKAEKAVSDLTITDLDNDQGINLFEKLTKYFKVKQLMKHIVRTQHLYLSKEHFYQKVIQHDMKLPDAIFTFKLLTGDQVIDDERKLAFTMSSNLNIEVMKSALKRLFVSHPINHKHKDIQIKQEAFYSKKYNQYDKKKNIWPLFMDGVQLPLPRGSLLLTTKFPEISGTHVIDPKRKD